MHQLAGSERLRVMAAAVVVVVMLLLAAVAGAVACLLAAACSGAKVVEALAVVGSGSLGTCRQ